MRDISERFWSKVDKRGADECWLWTASLSDNGYGIFGRDGGSRVAHRIAYELAVGPIPKGLCIDHLCRNRACVNPAHLEAVTNSENVRRGLAGKHKQVWAASRTHCKNGHPKTPENTFEGVDGNRRKFVRCRICAREQDLRAYYRKKTCKNCAPLNARVKQLEEALTAANEMTARYANFIRNHVRADDLELHPYLPELEGVVEQGRSALDLSPTEQEIPSS